MRVFVSRYAAHMAVSTRESRALGAFLRKWRERARLTTIEVGAHLDQTAGTVSRYELGELRVSWVTVTALLGLYGGTETDLAVARQLYEAAKNAPKPVRLPKETPPAFRRLVNEEQSAAGIRTVAPLVWPGLVQHEEYSLALGDQLHDPSSRSGGANNVRRARQRRLDPSEPSPLNFHAIVDEIVVTRLVGGRDVMRKQLRHILDVMDLDNVMIQVVKAEAGAYGASTGGLVIVEYDRFSFELDDTAADDEGKGDEAESAVYFEYPAGSAWVENQQDVQRFTKTFKRAARAALSPDKTADFVHQQMKVL
ncbi:helix-turn-helix domain-containing protein [Amycolatopsis sp. cmx-11-12]|uniref:helix-turn-helix domain-containing protein n=1 Tax=Amycolatopsis sp. cmx-11-12 TaxID=2785795 RepID=UPI00391853D8